MTRNGIVYDLQDSPYNVNTCGITFYFSSESHRSKFENMYVDNLEFMQNSMFKRFKFILDIEPVYALFFYKKIETRGFYIEYQGRGYKWLKSITLDGDQMILED